jgi:hypothetical protein
MIKLKNILSEILTEAQVETYGDLQKLMKSIFAKQKGAKIAQAGKDVAIDTVLSLIPGGGAAKNTFQFFKAAYSKPDAKKTDTWLDRLDVDDDMSAIVADDVEDEFLKTFAQDIDSEQPDKEIEADFDINQRLKDWLAGEYNQRTIDIKGIDLKKKKPTKGSVF